MFTITKTSDGYRYYPTGIVTSEKDLRRGVMFYEIARSDLQTLKLRCTL